MLADNLYCSVVLPEPLTMTTSHASSLGMDESATESTAKTSASSFAPVPPSNRSHKRIRLESGRLGGSTLGENDFDRCFAFGDNTNKLPHPSVRYNSFPHHTSTLFSLFLNSPLLPPATQWLYTQLYPNPYSAFHMKNTFDEMATKRDDRVPDDGDDYEDDDEDDDDRNNCNDNDDEYDRDRPHRQRRDERDENENCKNGTFSTRSRKVSRTSVSVSPSRSPKSSPVDERRKLSEKNTAEASSRHTGVWRPY